MTDYVAGMRVRYFPVVGGPRSYEGILDGEPYQLAGGHWVVRVRDLPEAYRAATGASRCSVIAWLGAVEPAEKEGPP